METMTAKVDEILQKLLDGNDRFVKSSSVHKHQTQEDRYNTANNGQHPEVSPIGYQPKPTPYSSLV